MSSFVKLIKNEYPKTNKEADSHMKNFLDFGDNKIEFYKDQDYETLKNDCLQNRKLFEDPLFPVNDSSISKNAQQGIVWKRPSDFIKWPFSPCLIYNQAIASDLDPGQLGDSWFVIACAALTSLPDLFAKVVPKDQFFSGRFYAGIFHFRFHIFGKFYDVVVDDRLPVYANSNTLVFCRNKVNSNELWASLLEKAYAKLNSSYENLKLGFVRDALIDLTGGLPESISICDKSENHREIVWTMLRKGRVFKTLMATSMRPDLKNTIAMSHGLVTDYAYYITKIAMLEVNSNTIRLLRLNNPWSGETEYTGPWSDKSDDWNILEDEFKEALEYKNIPKGEFWIPFEEFYKYFHTIEFINLTSDACIADEDYNQNENEILKWKLTTFKGEWTPGSTAGGCGQNNEALFWTNLQLLVNLKNIDSNDNLATILISLIQKSSVDRYGKTMPLEFIQFRIYRVKNEEDAEVSRKTGMRLYAGQLQRYGSSGKYKNTREVGKRYRLDKGSYVIIASCYSANRRAEFLLRILTEQTLNSSDCKILENHKDNLSYDDLFYFTKYDDEKSYSLLGIKNDLESSDDSTKNIDSSSSVIIKSTLKPIKTPVFETFEKIVYKQENTHKNCVLM